jgi:hypothetical protein
MIHVYTTDHRISTFQIIGRGTRIGEVDIRCTPEAAAGIRCIAIDSVPVEGVESDKQGTAAEGQNRKIGTVLAEVGVEKSTHEVKTLPVAATMAEMVVEGTDTKKTIVLSEVAHGTLAGPEEVHDTLAELKEGLGTTVSAVEHGMSKAGLAGWDTRATVRDVRVAAEGMVNWWPALELSNRPERRDEHMGRQKGELEAAGTLKSRTSVQLV